MSRDESHVFPMGPERKSTRVRAAFFKVARCPFCHDEVDAEWEDWVQCARCHALQHRSCWGESACCATCRWAQTTADYVPTAPAPAPPRRQWWTRSRADAVWSAAAMAVVVAVLLLVTAPPVRQLPKVKPFAGLTPEQVAVLKEAERYRIEQAEAIARQNEQAAAERAQMEKTRKLQQLREQWELIEAQRRKEDAQMLAQGAYWLRERANGVAGDPDAEWNAAHGTSKIK